MPTRDRPIIGYPLWAVRLAARQHRWRIAPPPGFLARALAAYADEALRNAAAEALEARRRREGR